MEGNVQVERAPTIIVVPGFESDSSVHSVGRGERWCIARQLILGTVLRSFSPLSVAVDTVDRLSCLTIWFPLMCHVVTETIAILSSTNFFENECSFAIRELSHRLLEKLRQGLKAHRNDSIRPTYLAASPPIVITVQSLFSCKTRLLCMVERPRKGRRSKGCTASSSGYDFERC